MKALALTTAIALLALAGTSPLPLAKGAKLDVESREPPIVDAPPIRMFTNGGGNVHSDVLLKGLRRRKRERRKGGNGSSKKTEGEGEREIFLGIFMQPPAYENSNCATFRREFEALNGLTVERTREEVASMEVENSDFYPTDGIHVTLPPDSNSTCCVSSYYTRWAEQAGVRVIPIPTFVSDADLRWYLDRVNGVLFTGGIILDDHDVMRHYVNRATIIYDYAVAKHEGRGPTSNGLPAREHFPLWGTCQGFEILHIVAAGGYPHNFKILQTNFTGMRPAMLPMTFYPSVREESTLLSKAPASLLDAMEEKGTTLNFHVKGVPPSVFDPSSPNYYPSVDRVFRPLSVSWDSSEQPFVAAIEGRNGLPIYAVQFHPEKPQFDFTNAAVGHDDDTLGIAAYFSYFLASELKKNGHAFDSRAEANRLTINKYPLVNMGYGLQYYFV